LVDVKRRSYRVTALREGRWWLLRVPELDIVTQTRRLARAEQTARDLIATWLGADPGSLDVEVVPAVGDEVTDRLIGEAVEARASAARQSSRAMALTDQAVHRLVAKGVPLRDVGEMLGISHQRVAQLARSSISVVKDLV
jgi:DNA-binding CsgD family transcriptional regulator